MSKKDDRLPHRKRRFFIAKKETFDLHIPDVIFIIL